MGAKHPKATTQEDLRRDLIRQGYTPKAAAEQAARQLPTPRQAALQKAHAARKARAAARRDASKSATNPTTTRE